VSDRESHAVFQAEEIDSESSRVLVTSLVELIERARIAAVPSVNSILTSTYWLIGQGLWRGTCKSTLRASLLLRLPCFLQ
jgi:hypothetical protein